MPFLRDRQRITLALVLLFGSVVLLGSPGRLDAHRLAGKGPYQGYREQYKIKPVLEDSTRLGHYDLFVVVFDQGSEAHLIAYAKPVAEAGYFAGLLRVMVTHPDGRVFVTRRNHEFEVVDEPIRWPYAKAGSYTLQITLDPLKTPPFSTSFTVNLQHRRSYFWFLGTLGVIIAGLMVTVGLIRYKQQTS